MGQAVGHNRLQLARQIPRERVGHLNRRRQFRRTPEQHVLQVLPRVLASADEQGNFVPVTRRHDPRSEHPRTLRPRLLRRTLGGVFRRAFRRRPRLILCRWCPRRARGRVLGQGRLPGSLAHQLQDLDPRVVVMNHVALGRLPNQFFPDRLGTLGLGLHDVPLGRGGQRNSQVLLEFLLSVEWHAIAIFQEGNHAAHGRVVLLLCIHACWQLGGKEPAAKMATQLLEIIHQGCHGRLAHQPHQHAWTAGVVERAVLALRARIARPERLVTHLDLLGAGVGIGPVAASASGDTPSATFKPPITAEVFSVFAPKSICRNRRIVVSLSPTTLTRYT